MGDDGAMKTPITALLLGLPLLAAGADDPWPVVGQQGLVRQVIVPTEHAKQREAYLRQITLLCGTGDRTCFLNFYTNSSGAALAVPLPDAITNEPTAVFRRSSKQQGEYFRFSCRLQVDLQNCF
jgi:hypothetical protein